MPYVMPPNVLTPEMFTYNVIPEPSASEDAWAIGTTYAASYVVISATTHRKYQSLKDGNVGHDPTNIANAGVWWSDIGPTNKYALIDGTTNSKSQITGTLTVVLTPGFFDTILISGMSGSHLSVTVKKVAGGDVIFSYYRALDNSIITNMYEFYTAPFNLQTEFLATGIAPYLNAEVTISITGSGSSIVKCGVIAFGIMRNFGSTDICHGAKGIPRTAVKFVNNPDGSIRIVNKREGNDFSGKFYLEKNQANSVFRLLKEIGSTPAYWGGTTLAEYDFLRSWGSATTEIIAEHTDTFEVQLSVIGLIK
ncbi:MAG: hypothetical protein K2X63_04325 [Burkholderiaceae bacterium]|nr:hypothetical protein [Burkholderiaceae bacterium]